ncbi:hypothetical protein HYZ78_00065 [Candidatus Microgenomates bacterium]|nr:hypothetical protein [Candidatus Microgenomates bacterium]
MKKILASFILSLLTFLLSSSAIFADNQSEIIIRVDSDITVANNLISDMEVVQDNPEAVSEALLKDIPPVTAHWSESSAFYESKIASEVDEQLKTILTNINIEIKGLTLSLLQVEKSIKTNDRDTFENAFDQYDRHMELLNTHVESLNNHFGAADYSWLAWPFWIALVISVVLFLISRGSPVLPAEQLRNQFEFALFKSSLWPLAGTAISYFWYLATPPGETFYAFWGLIGVGFFQFARGLHTYVTEARPSINLAKSEEKSKLEALIRSEKFQKESMEEKVKDIERRKPVLNLSRSVGGKNSLGEILYCRECGVKNKKTANYCKACGKRLN